MRPLAWSRAAGAAALAVAGVLLLRAGGVGWVPALLCGLGAAAFVAWRTVAGVCAGFALLLGAALDTWTNGPRTVAALAPALPALGLLELLGPLTIVAVALARDPRRVSRRLLGAWLFSSGLLALGLAAIAAGATRQAGSALVAGALAYKLGVVPAYAWAPMLLRHPSRHIAALGVAALLGAGAVLARVAPLLPDHRSAAATLAVLGALTVPWAAWHALRQRRSDPRCARTYVAVALVASMLLVFAALLRQRA